MRATSCDKSAWKRRESDCSALPEALSSCDSGPKIEQQLRAAIGHALVFALATGGATGAAAALAACWWAHP